MTTPDIVAAAVPYAVQALVAIALGTYGWWHTAHNAAVAEIRRNGPRPSLHDTLRTAPDEELRRRYFALRAAADRRAAA